MIRQERARKQKQVTYAEVAEEAAEAAEETIVYDTIWTIEPEGATESAAEIDTTFTIIDISDEMLEDILRISESHGTGLMFNGPR